MTMVITMTITITMIIMTDHHHQITTVSNHVMTTLRQQKAEQGISEGDTVMNTFPDETIASGTTTELHHFTTTTTTTTSSDALSATTVGDGGGERVINKEIADAVLKKVTAMLMANTGYEGWYHVAVG